MTSTKQIKYPTLTEDDFDYELIKEASSVLKGNITSIFIALNDMLQRKQKRQLLIYLRLLLDMPMNEITVSCLGWFVVNGMMPAQTLMVYFHQLTSLLPSTEGIKLNIIFASAIAPKLNKYIQFAKTLLSVPSLQFYDHHLYIFLTQLLRESIPIEFFDVKQHFVFPKTQKAFPPIKYFAQEQEFPSIQDSYVSVKPNLFASIEYARQLSKEEQLLYCVHICLVYPPPNVRIWFEPLLIAACGYSNLLLSDAQRLEWSAFEMHPQLSRMGSWIGSLTLAIGKPPPLHLLNIPRMLREAAANGTIGHSMVFITALFEKASSSYAPPNPLTEAVLEVLAAILHVDGLRSDVVEKIKNFGRLMKVDLSIFYNRTINIPINSFDRYAQFYICGPQRIFKPPGCIHPDEADTYANDALTISSYFHYVPDQYMLPNELRKVFNDAQRVEKYYFVGQPSDVGSLSENISEQDMLQCIISLALADSPVLACTASKLFKKTTRSMQPINLAPVFRCAFPNRYIISSCLLRNCFAPADINSLFSELLTNPETEQIAKPMILSFMPLCLQLSSSHFYSSVCEILGISPPNKGPEKIPLPDTAHMSLLKSFLSYCKSKDPGARTDFIAKLVNTSIDAVCSLLLFVYGATNKRNSPKLTTFIDYSAVDCLCIALGKCSGRYDIDAISSRFFEAITRTTNDIIKFKALALFRLVYGLFSHLHFKSNERMINLLQFLSPANYPSFTNCWMQLVMHRAAFPHLIRTNEAKSVTFCVSFIITLIKLSSNHPDLFYKSSCRILMTIASSSPTFFIAYHCLILEALPNNFTQFRNIILSTTINREDHAPPIGFNYKDVLQSKAVLVLIDPLLRSLSIESNQQSNAQFITSVLKRSIVEFPEICIPRVVWQLVFYSINTVTYFILHDEMGYGTPKFQTIPIVELFIQISNLFYDSSVRIFYSAILDQIRYPNPHTSFAMNLISTLFDSGDFINRRIILVEIIRRLLCVTQPPTGVRQIFKQIAHKYSGEIKNILTQSNEYENFKKVQKAIDCFKLRRSSSGHIYIVHE